ncbi:DUF6702 family protein [Planctomycetes bacterium K23_9]|uniref:Uncharacterized protein n=1 Tax=Stieleria marina TaxID=1930275 RepID=A0A517NTX6_9BACT|nr:hypothetical protein K239x_25330 [Planctomycetes bacterium K23_9]
MCLLFVLTALLHPVHETVSELQWNAQTRRVEVALRMSVLDEEWVKRNQGPGIRKENTRTWAVSYLSETFRIDPGSVLESEKPNAKKSVYHWVGRKEEGAHVWWFFEIEPVDKKKPRIISQEMFFSREQGYSNRVLILGSPPASANGTKLADPDKKTQPARGGKQPTVSRRSVTLTIQRPTAKLDASVDDKQENSKL